MDRQLAHLNRGHPVIPSACGIVRSAPSFEVGNVAARDTVPTTEVGVVVESDFGSMHHFDGRDTVVVTGRKVRVGLATAHAEILAGVIDVFVETVLHKNLEKRVIYVGLAVCPIRQPQSPSLWECGNPRPLRVSKLRGRAERLASTFHHSALGAPIPQRDLGFSPILARNCCLGRRRSGDRCLSESRAERTFLQILAQSR